jgi:hypothetical protein
MDLRTSTHAFYWSMQTLNALHELAVLGTNILDLIIDPRARGEPGRIAVFDRRSRKRVWCYPDLLS